MTTAKYTLITLADCDSDFMSTAVPLTVQLARELEDKAGSVGARPGIVMTGEEAGALFLAQSYADIGGIERAIDVYGSSDAYAGLIGSGKVRVKMRSLIKLEDIGIDPSPDALPKFLVITRFRSADPNVEGAKKVVPVFEDNGAVLLRFGTSIAGPMAGVRVLGVGYPSMAAIEQTYDALAENADYKDYTKDIEIVGRTIIKATG